MIGYGNFVASYNRKKLDDAVYMDRNILFNTKNMKEPLDLTRDMWDIKI